MKDVKMFGNQDSTLDRKNTVDAFMEITIGFVLR